MRSLGRWFFEDIWVLVQTCTIPEMEVMEVRESELWRLKMNRHYASSFISAYVECAERQIIEEVR